MFKPFAAPGLCGNKKDWTACTQDLTATPVTALADGHPFLHAQHWIDQILHRIESGDTTTDPAPQAIFNDLRALGCWILRRAQPGDFAKYGPDAEAGCHAYLAEQQDRTGPAGVFAPTSAAATAAALTDAVAILDGPRDHAVTAVSTLIDRGQPWEGDMVPLDRTGRNDISPHLRAVILHARDTSAISRERLRYRTCTTSPRLPDLPMAHRVTQVPQLLWPQWTLLLKPPNTEDEWFRTAISAALLIPGSTDGDMASAAEILSPDRRTGRRSASTDALNKAAKHWRGKEFLQTVCILADYLDQHHTPINYHRRRQLDTSELLAEPVWELIASTHNASRRLRHHFVRAWLYQHITGNRLADAPPPFTATTGHDRREINEIARYLHQNLRRALDDHAQRYLQQHGINEPITWHPPVHLAPPDIPRPAHVNIPQLHTLAARLSKPLGHIAKHFGTSLAHIRLLLAEHPLPTLA